MQTAQDDPVVQEQVASAYAEHTQLRNTRALFFSYKREGQPVVHSTNEVVKIYDAKHNRELPGTIE